MHCFPENQPFLPLPLAYISNKTSHLLPLLFFHFPPVSPSLHFQFLQTWCIIYWPWTGRCKEVCEGLNKGWPVILSMILQAFPFLKNTVRQREMARMALLQIPKEELWLIQRFHLKTDSENAHRLHSVTPSPHSQGSPAFKGHSSSFLLQDKCTW